MEKTIEKIISLAKRRGFIFPSSKIYGGLGGVYDFGPLGADMKKNIRESWIKYMKKQADNMVVLDSAILLNPKVWQASGHLSAGFADKLVECKSCHKRFREEEIKEGKCPECGGELTKEKNFNLMMKTFIGPVEEESAITYLRPETCQGIFVNFLNIMNSQRLSLPFGVMQTGKSFRNEINPKNFIFRTREFEQMEMEWFCSPEEADKWFDFWLEKRLAWYRGLGIKKENIRTTEVPEKERAHYAKRQVDIEYRFPFGWKEIEGIHNRGDWDLSNHSRYSGEDLSCEKENGKGKFFPYVIETSAGLERSLFAFLVEAYEEIKGGRTQTTEAVKESEVVLKISKTLAPVKAAILPLVRNNPAVRKRAKEVYELLKNDFNCFYDESGSIGRRYRRLDEIGCPFAITIDFDTLKQDDVTVRDRDTMKQKRVKIENLSVYLKKNLENQ